MKSFTLCVALATLACTTAMADDAPRGRRIGNGVNLPREIVANKDPATRAGEIWRWMSERVSETKRDCATKQKLCVDTIVAPLDTGAALMLMRIQPTDGRRDIDVYCRSNKQIDVRFCYRMQTDEYFIQTKDSQTKNWDTTWEEKPAQAATPAKPKPTEVEL